MSRNKPKEIVPLPSKNGHNKHSIPRSMISVYNKLEELSFEKGVGTGKFFPSKKEQGLKIISFDERDKKYLIKVVYKGYEQMFYLGADERRREYDQAITDILIKL
jgi:hypothetical protein